MKGAVRRARVDSSSSNEGRREAEARGSGIFNGLKICIINAKIKPETIGELSDLAEDKGARLVANADHADIVITEIGAKQRLERHMTWEAAVSRTCFRIDIFANLRSPFVAKKCGVDTRLAYGLCRRKSAPSVR
jgi:hypothetical protein